MIHHHHHKQIEQANQKHLLHIELYLILVDFSKFKDKYFLTNIMKNFYLNLMLSHFSIIPVVTCCCSSSLLNGSPFSPSYENQLLSKKKSYS